MNGNGQGLLRACVALVLLLGSVLTVVPAWAETPSVSADEPGEIEALGDGLNDATSSSGMSIRYVDKEGNSLGVIDTVIVDKSCTYTAPSRLYITEGDTVHEYQIADRSQAVLMLEPDEAENGQTYEFRYEPIRDDAVRTWTVVLENGAVSPDDPGRIIRRIDLTGVPGTTQTFDASSGEYARIEVNGKIYVPVEASARVFEHTFSVGDIISVRDMDVEQSVYYVPEGSVSPEPYDINVRYVNVSTNEVLTTDSYPVSPIMRSDLEIESPETFSSQGIEWVRLNGQELPIRHSYYSPTREYVVYYRDINDDLNASRVVRIVRAVYVDEEGNTVTRPRILVGTQSDGVIDMGLQTGENLLVLDGRGIVTADGSDLASVRTEREETPVPSTETIGPAPDTDSIPAANDSPVDVATVGVTEEKQQKGQTTNLTNASTSTAVSERTKTEPLAKTGDVVPMASAAAALGAGFVVTGSLLRRRKTSKESRQR